MAAVRDNELIKNWPIVAVTLTLSEDETRLEHQLTVSDDEVFTGPAVGRVPLNQSNNHVKLCK